MKRMLLVVAALISLGGCSLAEMVDAIRIDQPGWCAEGTPVEVDGQAMCQVLFESDNG